MLINGNLGIDMSAYENWRQANKDKKYYFISPDFTQMRSQGVTWASIRKSRGLDQDQAFTPTMQAADTQIERQPYHWWKPKKGTAQAQTDAFLTGYIPGELPPLLDLENTKWESAYRGIGSELRIWLEAVENADGRAPEIYANPSYIKSYFTNQDTWLRRYKLIIAHWEMNFPIIPQPWLPTDCAGWQFTGSLAYAPTYGIPIVPGFGSIKEAALYVRFA